MSVQKSSPSWCAPHPASGVSRDSTDQIRCQSSCWVGQLDAQSTKSMTHSMNMYEYHEWCRTSSKATDSSLWLYGVKLADSEAARAYKNHWKPISFWGGKSAFLDSCGFKQATTSTRPPKSCKLHPNSKPPSNRPTNPCGQAERHPDRTPVLLSKEVLRRQVWDGQAAHNERRPPERTRHQDPKPDPSTHRPARQGGASRDMFFTSKPSSLLLLVAMPFAPSSVLAPSSTARSP